MPTLDLTDAPLTLVVSLTRGSDFDRLIEPLDGGTFPEGTELVLDFGETDQWPAVVTPTSATWHVDKAVSDTLFDKAPASCKLRYKAGESDRVWATGTVVLYG